MFDNMLYLLILIAVGYFINRKMNAERLKTGIKHFLIYLGIPGIVFYSLVSFDAPVAEFMVISIAVAISFFSYMLLSWVGNEIFNKEDKGIYVLLISFPNSGFLGLPICYVLFGESGLYFASIYILICTLIHYTIGLFLSLQSEFKDVKFALKGVGRFPMVYSMCIILVLFLLDLDLPSTVLSGLYYLGELTTFLAVFFIGASLELFGDDPVGSIAKESTYVGAFRFFISPVIMFLLCIYFEIKPDILVLEASMPPAISNTVLAAHYSMNKGLSANITTVLTVVFIITFSLISFVI